MQNAELFCNSLQIEIEIDILQKVIFLTFSYCVNFIDIHIISTL